MVIFGFGFTQMKCKDAVEGGQGHSRLEQAVCSPELPVCRI